MCYRIRRNQVPEELGNTFGLIPRSTRFEVVHQQHDVVFKYVFLCGMIIGVSVCGILTAMVLCGMITAVSLCGMITAVSVCGMLIAVSVCGMIT